jgi:hypothetical protein
MCQDIVDRLMIHAVGNLPLTCIQLVMIVVSQLPLRYLSVGIGDVGGDSPLFLGEQLTANGPFISQARRARLPEGDGATARPRQPLEGMVTGETAG